MLDWLNAFLQHHQSLIGLVIFLIVFFDCIALLGLAIPGNTMVVIASAVAGSYNYPLWKVIILGILGGWLGDIISYGIGYKLKKRVYQLSFVKKNPKWINSADNYLKHYGIMGLVLGRFVSPLRSNMSMMVGIFHYPVVTFLIVTLMASSLWTITFVVPSWLTGVAFSFPVDEQFWMTLIYVVAILAIFIAISVYGCLKQKRWVTAYMSLASFVLLLLLYLFLPNLNTLDQGVLAIVQTIQEKPLEKVAHFITELGGYKVQFVISAVLCFLLLFMKQIKPLCFFAFTMLATATIGWILKESIARVRPFGMSDVVQTFSFPSGHTSASFAFFVSIGVLAGLGRPPKQRLMWLSIAFLPAFLIGLSRIYLNMHWLTDVIAGALLAVGISMFVLTWVEFHKKMQPLPMKCWKILLPITLIVLICGAVISLRAL